jgi:MinD-like ATPase involved in chromosome partitioning or flagellar assembly
VSVPVLTAVADPAWESGLVAQLGPDEAVRVVRRCVDLADLLSAATAGLGRAVILSGRLRRLDREAVSRLTAAGVAVVGLVATDDNDGGDALRRLGVTHLVAPGAERAEISATVRAAVEGLAAPARAASTGWSGEGAIGVQSPPDEGPGVDVAGGTGRIVAVWGPTGAPGRSTVAVNLAAELAASGESALLIDADSYGGSVAILLGILDESSGLVAACRAANQGRLDVAGLASLALEVRPGMRVLTGIPRAERWLELRPSALDVVLDLARALVAVTVVDCGFCLEHDEELAYDTTAPRRNGAALAILGCADEVVAVGAADPVGLTRFVRGYPELSALRAGRSTVTVINRYRRTVAGSRDARGAVGDALARFAGIADPHWVPDDPAAFDSAVATGRALVEVAPGSAARQAIRTLALRLAGQPPATAARSLRWARWRPTGRTVQPESASW